jgi:3-deoxy-D-manno-octulosonic-acid transferase
MLYHETRLDVIKLLAKRYLISVKIKNKHRRLLVHCVSMGRATFDVIEFLVKKYPTMLRSRTTTQKASFAQCLD